MCNRQNPSELREPHQVLSPFPHSQNINRMNKVLQKKKKKEKNLDIKWNISFITQWWHLDSKLTPTSKHEEYQLKANMPQLWRGRESLIKNGKSFRFKTVPYFSVQFEHLICTTDDKNKITLVRSQGLSLFMFSGKSIFHLNMIWNSNICNRVFNLMSSPFRGITGNNRMINIPR